jgi:hypothetical protein
MLPGPMRYYNYSPRGSTASIEGLVVFLVDWGTLICFLFLILNMLELEFLIEGMLICSSKP